MSQELFTAYKRPADVVDFYIDCTDEFALTDPADQIDTVSWAVEMGDVVIDSSRVEGTTQAIARVSGGTKLWSWHSIRATITCVSGQVYTPLIKIQLNL
jgi:hypothetical protein